MAGERKLSEECLVSLVSLCSWVLKNSAYSHNELLPQIRSGTDVWLCAIPVAHVSSRNLVTRQSLFRVLTPLFSQMRKGLKQIILI